MDSLVIAEELFHLTVKINSNFSLFLRNQSEKVNDPFST